MKRVIILITVIMLVMLSGCKEPEQTDDGKLKIVTTIFPLYDWVREVTGNDDIFDVTLLQDTGTDLHNYQPTVSDMVKVSQCDVFIYVGGESDQWVNDALKTAVNKDMKVLCLMEAISDRIRYEETKEGMNPVDEPEEEEYDEHIWLSLRNAEACVMEIGKVIEEKLQKHDVLEGNMVAYLNKLKELDEEYENTVNAAEKKVLLFTDRFPFLYLVKDYGIDYYAAFRGCSAESEASFETVSFLTGKVNELQLDHVMILENGNRKLAQTVIRDSERPECEINELNSLQSATLQNGRTYLEIMKDNLKVLERVLN